MSFVRKGAAPPAAQGTAESPRIQAHIPCTGGERACALQRERQRSASALNLANSHSLPPISFSLAPGTRPGPAGATLVSTGLAGLDALLGGGAPLSRLLLVAVGGAEVSGGAGSNSDTGAGGATAVDLLARVFLAEGVARGQPGLWVQAGVGEGGEAPSSSSSSPWWLPGPAALGRGRSSGSSAADAAPDAGAGLRIAWQYRQYIAGNAGGGSGGGGGSSGSGGRNPKSALARGTEAGWASPHDCARRAAPDGELVTCVAAGPGTVARVASFIRAAPPSPAPPRRVVLAGLGSPAWMEEGSAAGGADPDAPAAWDAVVRTLRTLRAALRAGEAGGDAPVALLVSLPARLFPPAALARAAAAADGVLALDALRSDSGLASLLPDPTAVCGLARAVRLPGVGLGGLPRSGSAGGGAALHALRLKRGKLSLVPADIDPDAEEAVMGAGGSGSGGGGACAAGPPGGRAAEALAF